MNNSSGDYVNKWKSPAKCFASYNSFRSFLSLLNCFECPSVQLFAIWSIQYLCGKNREYILIVFVILFNRSLFLLSFVLLLSREILPYVSQRGSHAFDSIIIGVTECWPQKYETNVWTDSGFRSTVFKPINV